MWGRVVKSPPPLLKGYNVGGESQAQSWSSFQVKPHRPTAAGRLSDVGPERCIIPDWCEKSSPKLRKFAYPSYPNATGLLSPAELSVVKICGLWQRGKIGKIWQLYGLGNIGRIWQLCGCRWLAMAVIIRRDGTDNHSPDEPRMAVIIRRYMALARCGGGDYQTFIDR